MPELFIELFSEEIPARMQARAADDFARLLKEALAVLEPADIETFYGPRRIAARAVVSAAIAESRTSERGPRATAPEQAVAGFLRKHGATREDLRVDADFFVLDRVAPARSASDIVAAAMPLLLRRFPWPKSMRWGGGAFTWVRPLRRIVCLLGGAVVPFTLADGADDGHGLVSGDTTEGHRFHAPAPFAVSNCADWERRLRDARVMVRASERRDAIAHGIGRLAAARGLTVVDDPGLLDELAGLVEWPVPLLGRIDDGFMDLPPEVMQVSMRVNQRYFALRTADGRAAPCFGFVANVEADDGGAAIVAGNERVLRARFSDARHFWNLDLTQALEERLPDLSTITFHAKIGSQSDRVGRLTTLAALIADRVDADVGMARQAARLAKADLVTGMVGEFPELQGVMGRYYALHDGCHPFVADAVRDHYAPRGPGEAVPTGRISVAVALADKIDTLLAFFRIGEKPTGSGDPYALRRAALGVIRLILENGLGLPLFDLLKECEAVLVGNGSVHGDVFAFILERLRVQLRADGIRPDALDAVLTTDRQDLTDIVRLVRALAAFLATPEGDVLLAGYRRASNILEIEDRKDGPHDGPVDPALLAQPAERDLAARLAKDAPLVARQMNGHYEHAMHTLASLSTPIDRFFTDVLVNEPAFRRNRLALCAEVRRVARQVADFSRIGG